MAKEVLEPQSLNELLNAAVHLVRLPRNRIWLDYDPEAHVLYVQFEDKPPSTYSEPQENGIILDYDGEVLVGVTILEASQREVALSAA